MVVVTFLVEDGVSEADLDPIAADMAATAEDWPPGGPDTTDVRHRLLLTGPAVPPSYACVVIREDEGGGELTDFATFP